MNTSVLGKPVQYNHLKQLPHVFYHLGTDGTNLNYTYAPSKDIGEIPKRQKKAYEKMGFPLEFFDDRVIVAQVQSPNIYEINQETHRTYRVGDNPENALKGDAVWTRMPNVALVTGYNDCPQILFASKEDKFIGIVHANRATLDAFIIHNFIDSIHNDLDPKSIVACISPYLGHFAHNHIQRIKRGNEWLNSGVLMPSNESWNLDLGLAIRNDLIAMGLSEENIEDPCLDTYSMAKASYADGGDLCSFAFWKEITQNKDCSLEEFLTHKEKPSFPRRCGNYLGIMISPL